MLHIWTSVLVKGLNGMVQCYSLCFVYSVVDKDDLCLHRLRTASWGQVGIMHRKHSHHQSELTRQACLPPFA
jgi:hypothetical protein